MYDVIVVGRGFFGASAIRYLSQMSDRVAVIGPDEPEDVASHQGVFGAHYDEGRLTYQLKRDPVWAGMARAALARFPAIESESGVRFYSPVGGLYVADAGQDPGHFKAAETAVEEGISAALLDGEGLANRFPFLRVSETSQSLWEGPPAGYLSPRRFIQAQRALSPRATVINQMVVGVETRVDRLMVRTADGNQYEARKVLLAAGAYSNNFGLLPQPLALTVKQEYVIRAALPPEEVGRLADMVPIVYEIDHPRLAELYILPPIQYPDGRYYLKMGANTVLDRFVETAEEINDWYRQGDSDAMLDEMRTLVLTLFPGLKAEGWQTHRCVITRTAHKRPYIDAILPGQLYVAVGGNGQGAKVADEVGRLAAGLILDGTWAGEEFSAVFR